MEKRVSKIPIRQWDTDKKPRACAYVRVSTVHTKQLDSLENQTDYYRNMLSSSPIYEFCGIYSDAGISGAKENRPGFEAMIDAARNGDIDIIFTKSLSRFARNTVLLLKTVRELKALGVRVMFEKEKLDTMSAEGELALTAMASIAEEERKSTCENVKWTIRKKYEQGRLFFVDEDKLLGYDKTKDLELVINEQEAEVIKMIFKLYLSVKNGSEVARRLNGMGIPSYNNNQWQSSRILSIISNEKYAGDLLLQKSYVDTRGIEVANKGQRPQYLIQDNHPAIINRKDWNRTQKIRNSRRRK